MSESDRRAHPFFSAAQRRDGHSPRVTPLAQTLRAQAAALRSVADALDAQADLAEMEPVPDPFVAGRELGVDAVTWRRACRTGELPAALLGRTYKARRSDIDKWLASRLVEPRPAGTHHHRARGLPRADDGEFGLDELDRALGRGRAREERNR